MNRKPFLVAIAAAALTFGATGATWAHEPAPLADDQCGAQGEQTTDQNDDLACGAEEKDQTGDQGEKQDGKKGTDETGPTETEQSGPQGQADTGQQGDTNN